MTHLWGAALATGGGGLALIFNWRNSLELVIGILGILFLTLFLNAYFNRYAEIKRLIENIKED